MQILNVIKATTLGAAVWTLAVTASFAQGNGNGNAYGLGKNKFAAVPEIDAASGALAVAAVMAALFLVWEIRRRAVR